MSKSTYILEMLHIQKNFPGVKALQDVDFQLLDGEIHGLVGENGAGKSTLMKILAGMYSHDSGEIKFEGHVQDVLTPKLIEKLGIYFIHQERHVVPYLTVAETLFLGLEKTYTPFKFIKRRVMEKEAEKALLEKVGATIPGNKLMAELTVGEQQLIQICRALLFDPKVIVFDEPTAVLAKREQEKLFEIIRDLREKEISIIYISHYFKEILDICDRITVLRNGEKVKTIETTGLKIEDIVYMMAGRHIDDQFPKRNWELGESIIDVKNLSHETQFTNVSFNIHAGEIVGITGLMGSGHTSLGMALYDHTGVTSGSIEIEGKPYTRGNPEGSVANGIGYVPEDRRNLGIVQSMSVRENITLSSLNSVSKSGVINHKTEIQKVDSLISRLAIRTPDQEEAVNYLSGGNQQKVVIAKWLSSGSKLYILNQPTSAVDVGAKAEIYALINEMARNGAAVLLISQDLQEIVGLSDRILVMYRGQVIEEHKGDVTSDQIMVSMMGGNQDESTS